MAPVDQDDPTQRLAALRSRLEKRQAQIADLKASHMRTLKKIDTKKAEFAEMDMDPENDLEGQVADYIARIEAEAEALLAKFDKFES